MFTKTLHWKRWAGPRSDLTRAIRHALDTLSEWSGYPSSCDTRATFRGGLTQQSNDPAILEELTRDDLNRLEDLSVTVTPDRDAWYADYEARQNAWRARAYEGQEAGEPPERPEFINARVVVRLRRDWIPLRVEVEGPNRDRVEGLAGRLAEILGRESLLVRAINPGPARAVVPMALLVVGMIVVTIFAPSKGSGLQREEAFWLLIVPAAGIIGWLALLLLPTLELLGEGQASRARRFRRWIVGSVVLAIAIGVLSPYLYDLLTDDDGEKSSRSISPTVSRSADFEQN